MPRYRRYGYVTVVTVEKQGELVTTANIGFHLNPKLANDVLDGIVKRRLGEHASNKVLEDEIVIPHQDMQGSAIRGVLIQCADGVLLSFSIQRWYVVVGRE